MEDLMILGGFGLLLIAVVFFVIHKLNKIRIERERVIEEERKRQVEETRKWRERMYEKMKKESPSTVPPRGKEMTKTYTPTHFSSPTQSVQSSSKDDGMDMLTSMMIFNAISDHHQQPSSPTYSERDSVTTQDTSPKSYDSGPSYRDDSPSSSWSSSSSSDSSSSWSSSDSSGPSSDW